MKTTLFMMMLLCSGCALFQKTSKTTAVDTQSSINQLESTQLVLKTVGKETQIFTYWNDSGVYQYHHIKEQIDQAKLNKVKTEEKQQAKQTVTTKKTEPLKIWIYIGLGVGVVVCFLILKKFPLSVFRR
jgi:maltose-binding protein MalE